MEGLGGGIPAEADGAGGGAGVVGVVNDFGVVDVHDGLELAECVALEFAAEEGDAGVVGWVILIDEDHAGADEAVGVQGEVGHVDIGLHGPVLVVGQRLGVPEAGDVVLAADGAIGVVSELAILGNATGAFDEVGGAPEGGVARGAVEVTNAGGGGDGGEALTDPGRFAGDTAGGVGDDYVVVALVGEGELGDDVGGVGGPGNVGFVFAPLITEGGAAGGGDAQGVGGVLGYEGVGRMSGDLREV